jgi:uncharacterized protein (DUF1330 family)
MATYMLVQIRGVSDPAGFGEYRQQVGTTMERYGGVLRVGGAEPDVREGDWRPTLVIIEFPNAEQARAWYDSPEYQPLKALRQRSAAVDLLFVDGI